MHSAKKIEKKNRVLQGVCLRKNVLFFVDFRASTMK